MGYKPIPREKQQFGGFLIAAIGMGGTGWSWHTALSEGYFYSETDFMMPFAIVLGLALIAIPGYKEERIARGEDISGLSGPGLITPRWWVVGAIATAAGFCNLMLLEGR